MSTPSISSTPSAVPKNDMRINVAGVVLGIVGFIVVIVIVYATLRLKRRRSGNGGDDGLESPRHGTAIDRAHPAAQITPFGSPEGETPRFRHTPGSDMRIALRRPDGAWQFADSRAPFTPIGVSEIDVLPSPVSSKSMQLPQVRPKERESKAAREARLGYDRDYDVEINPPPPAYGFDHGGYINHTKG